MEPFWVLLSDFLGFYESKVALLSDFLGFYDVLGNTFRRSVLPGGMGAAPVGGDLGESTYGRRWVFVWVFPDCHTALRSTAPC